MVSDMKRAVGQTDGQDLPCRLVSFGLQRRTADKVDVYLRSENHQGRWWQRIALRRRYTCTGLLSTKE
jgi:hypothetical protein